ncbi:MAG TPA: FABP family protein [Acidimicrobiales bacterium]|nr:FABP family protein [Acidimicrobiales bacterium]
MTDLGPEPHPALGDLVALIGIWTGHGRGFYPTIASFTYGEELRLGHVGKPFLTWAQRTWSLEDGRPLHSEVGYLRPSAPGGVELVLAHPTGVVEVTEGTMAAGRLELRSVNIGLTTTAKEVSQVTRTMELEGDTLSYVLAMAAVGEDLRDHLQATLHRSA